MPATSTASPGARQSDGALDGARTIALDQDALRLLQARDDAGDDGIAVLGARVVVGHDDDIGETLGDLAHHRTLARVAIAAAAEHTDQLAGAMTAGGAQRLLERVRRMCVVDDGERPAQAR